MAAAAFRMTSRHTAWRMAAARCVAVLAKARGHSACRRSRGNRRINSPTSSRGTAGAGRKKTPPAGRKSKLTEEQWLQVGVEAGADLLAVTKNKDMFANIKV